VVVVGKTVVVETKPGILVDVIGSVASSDDVVVTSATGGDVVDDATKLVVAEETGAATVVVTTSSTTVLTSLIVAGSEVLVDSIGAEFVVLVRVELSVGKTRLVVTKIAGLVDSERKYVKIN